MTNQTALEQNMVLFAFDCFGTVFDASSLPKEAVKDYVQYMRGSRFFGGFAEYIFPRFWYDLPAHADSAIGLAMIQSKGYQIAAFSNGSVELITELSNRAGIKWDWIIDLASAGVYKPDPGAYAQVSKQTDVPPDQIAVVTANPGFGDVEGASNAGMHPIIIRRLFAAADINEMASWLYGAPQ